MRHIISILLLLPCLSWGADWKNISISDDFSMQIDRSSIAILKDGSRKAWREFTYYQPQKNRQGKTYTRSVMLSLYNCAEKMIAHIQEVDYNQAMNDEVVKQVFTPQHQALFIDIVPGSFDNDALDFVCSYKIRRKQSP